MNWAIAGASWSFQKRNKQRRLRIWNFQGYQRNSVLEFLLSSCLLNFHVNIITGAGVKTIKTNVLTRNLEIENIPACTLPGIWILRQVRDTKSGMNISTEMLLNAEKCQGYRIYRFWVIKGKPTRGRLIKLLSTHVRVNGQISYWELLKSGVPQGSILGPLMFLIYISNLPDDILSTCKIFADDAYLFSYVSYKSTLQSKLNKDLQTMKNWASQWQLKFNPDPNKKAKEVYFSKKASNVSWHPVTFNNTNVVTCFSQKHLGFLLDQQLNFNDHIKSKMNKCYKMIRIIKRLSLYFPCDAFLKIFKSSPQPI